MPFVVGKASLSALIPCRRCDQWCSTVWGFADGTRICLECKAELDGLDGEVHTKRVAEKVDDKCGRDAAVRHAGEPAVDVVA